MESQDLVVTADVKIEIDVAEDPSGMAQGEGAESVSPTEPPGPPMYSDGVATGEDWDNTTTVDRHSPVKQPQVKLEAGVKVEPTVKEELDVSKPWTSYNMDSEVDSDSKHIYSPQVKLEPDVMFEPGMSCSTDSERDSDMKHRSTAQTGSEISSDTSHYDPCMCTTPSAQLRGGRCTHARVNSRVKLEPGVKVDTLLEWEPGVMFEPGTSHCADSKMDSDPRHDYRPQNNSLGLSNTSPVQTHEGLFVAKRIKVEPDGSQNAASTGSARAQIPEQPDRAEDQRRHNVTHTGQELENCSQNDASSAEACSQTLKERLKLKLTQRHQNPQGEVKRTNQEPYKCPQCDNTFRAYGTLARHMLTHSNQKQHTFTECGTSFRFVTQTPQNAQGEVKRSNQELYKCSQCDNTFGAYGTLARHMRTHSNQQQHTSVECGASFRFVTHLGTLKLVQSEELLCKCTLCDSSFKDAVSLNTHMLTHTDEKPAKPFKCTQCDATFRRGYYLKAHMLVHTHEKPHKCTICTACFKRPNDLKKHLSKIHTGQKPYKCSHCDAGFAEAGNLKKHMLTHTSKTPHKCTLCTASFSQGHILEHHMLIHTDDKQPTALPTRTFTHSGEKTDQFFASNETDSDTRCEPQIRLEPDVMSEPGPSHCVSSEMDSDCEPQVQLESDVRVEPGTSCSMVAETDSDTRHYRKPQVKQETSVKKGSCVQLELVTSHVPASSEMDSDAKHDITVKVKQEPDAMFEPGTSYCADSETDCDSNDRQVKRERGISHSSVNSEMNSDTKHDFTVKVKQEPDAMFEPGTSYCADSETDCDSNHDGQVKREPGTGHSSIDSEMGSELHIKLEPGVMFEPGTGHCDDEMDSDAGRDYKPHDEPEHDVQQEPGNGLHTNTLALTEPLSQLNRGRRGYMRDRCETEVIRRAECSGVNSDLQRVASVQSAAGAGSERPESPKPPDQAEDFNKQMLTLAQSYSLQSDKPVSVKKERFKCEQCDASFAQKCSLTRHMLIHTDQKPYKCTQCPASFRQSGGLKRHMMTHTDERPFKCSICEAKFRDACNLKMHRLTHSGEKPYKCQHCDASFRHDSTLRLHTMTHTGEKPYKCSDCHAEFRQLTKLRVHMLMHTGDRPHQCSWCDARFRRARNLRYHIYTHTGEKPYKCTQCDASFAQAYSVKKHMLIHSDRSGQMKPKPHQCTMCEAKFASKGELASHMLTHTGLKPYHCTECGASFRHLSSYKIHCLTHTGEKPYQCSQCDSRFRSAGNLKVHMVTHTGEKKYKCKHCDRNFGTLSILKTHMKTHTGEKPHQCIQCNARFTQASSLRSHMLLHTGEKPYECTQCGSTFRHSSNLRSHMLTHSGRKPHKCTQCDASFVQSGHLQRHLLTHSDEKPHICVECDARFRDARTLKKHLLTH